MKSLKILLCLIATLIMSTLIAHSQGYKSFMVSTGGPDGADVTFLAPLYNGSIIALTSTPGVYIYPDINGRWEKIDFSETVIYVDSTIILKSRLSGQNMQKSTDNGLSWVAMDSGLFQLGVYAIQGKSRAGKYTIGTGSGVYAWDTDHWKFIGLKDKWITAVGQDSAGYLLAASYSYWSVIYKQDSLGKWDSVAYISSSDKITYFTSDFKHNIFTSASGICRSTDNGRHWTHYNSITPSLYNSINRILYSPSGELLAITNAGIYLSTNNGDTWAIKNNTWPLGARYLCWDINHYLWLGTFDGIFRSTNNGLNWERINQGILETGISNLVCDSNVIMATNVAPSNLYRSTDNGNTWSSIRSAQTLYLWNGLFLGPQGKLWANSVWGGSYISSDYGDTWKNVSIPADIQTIDQKGKVWALKQKNDYYDPDTLFYSTNEGITWIKADSGLIDADFAFIKTLVCGPNSQLYASLASSLEKTGIYTSTDNGKYWKKIPSPHLYYVYKLAISQYGTIFALGDADTAMYRSTNNGVTWTLIGPAQGILTPKNIAFNSRGDIYVNHAHVAFHYSTDDGETWQSTGYSNMSWEFEIKSMVFNKDGYLFAATAYAYNQYGYHYNLNAGMGIFKSTKSTLTSVKPTINETPTTFRLAPNYPNPFNPSTTIHFSVPTKEIVTLKIFNILGQEITTLVNEEKMPNKYTVSWNASSASSGIYICQLKAGKYQTQQKMLLLK